MTARIDEQNVRLKTALAAVTARRNQPDVSSPSALGVDAAIADLSERRIAIQRDINEAQRSLDYVRADGVLADLEVTR